jgi:hypothetical protein
MSAEAWTRVGDVRPERLRFKAPVYDEFGFMRVKICKLGRVAIDQLQHAALRCQRCPGCRDGQKAAPGWP